MFQKLYLTNLAQPTSASAPMLFVKLYKIVFDYAFDFLKMRLPVSIMNAEQRVIICAKIERYGVLKLKC
jgi:hypothetical protein